MPGAINKAANDVAKALQQPITVAAVSGKSAVVEFVRTSLGIPESVSSGALSIESASITARDLAMLRRRSLMGESQSDAVVDPSVLVVRVVEGIGEITKRTLENLTNPALAANFAGNDVYTLEGKQQTAILFATDRFLLQQVNEPDQEKIGPIYTFAKPKLYCSGRQPKIYTYGGTLVDNAIDGSAKAFWWSAYDEYLRGSKCVQNNALVELYFRDQIRRGYLLHTNMTESANSPSITQFAFSMHVIDEGNSGSWSPDESLNVKDIVDRD